MSSGGLVNTWKAPERRGGVRLYAVQRVIAVPVFLLVGLLQPGVHVRAGITLAAGMLVLELVQVPFLLGERWTAVPLPRLMVLDILGMAAAVALSGGGDSDLRFLTALMLFTPAIVLPRRTLVLLSSLLVVAVMTPSLLINASGHVLVSLVTFAFVCVLIAAVGHVNDGLLSQLERRADDRRRLLARVLDADIHRRRLLAQEIHDRALQTLLAARQDLVEAQDGSMEALGVARRQIEAATTALREAVQELHHGALTGTQLNAALRALVARTRLDDHLTIELELSVDSVEPHDELLFALAREAVVNAVRRPDAGRLRLSVRAGEPGEIVMEVWDDGRQQRAGDFAGDVGAGRPGLEAFVERIAEAGGVLRLDARPGEGTCVIAQLPVALPHSLLATPEAAPA